MFAATRTAMAYLRAAVTARRATPTLQLRALTGGPAVAGDWTEDAAAQIAAKGAAAGVKFYLFNFVDLFGGTLGSMTVLRDHSPTRETHSPALR